MKKTLLCLDTNAVNFSFTESCIKSVSADGLVNNRVYTASAVVLNNDGKLCYVIDDLPGDAKRLALRFIEIKKPAGILELA